MLVRVFWRRLSILALFILVVIVGLGVWKVLQKERDSRELRQQAELQRQGFAEQSSNLSQRIAELKTDRGKEEALRQQYEVGKPGEALIVIVEPESAAPIQASSTVRQWVRKFLPFW